jgi:hypothetical protein
MKTEINQPASPAPPSVPCRCLRTKRMYIPALAEDALDLEQNQNDQSFYWCNKTLSALGPDDNQVHPSLCQPGRSCHEA